MLCVPCESSCTNRGRVHHHAGNGGAARGSADRAAAGALPRLRQRKRAKVGDGRCREGGRCPEGQPHDDAGPQQHSFTCACAASRCCHIGQPARALDRYAYRFLARNLSNRNHPHFLPGPTPKHDEITTCAAQQQMQRSAAASSVGGARLEAPRASAGSAGLFLRVCGKHQLRSVFPQAGSAQHQLFATGDIAVCGQGHDALESREVAPDQKTQGCAAAPFPPVAVCAAHRRPAVGNAKHATAQHCLPTTKPVLSRARERPHAHMPR